jgi:hypothetical protein
MEVCGDSATQYGELEIALSHFHPKVKTETPQYSGNKISLHNITPTGKHNFKLNLDFKPKGILIIRGLTNVLYGTTTRLH